MKKIIAFILLGLLNTLHGLLHIIQFIQSAFLASGSNDHIHTIMENPIFSISMGIIGIITLIIGIRDWIHHRKCKH
jgi:hypothetical protein